VVAIEKPAIWYGSKAQPSEKQNFLSTAARHDGPLAIQGGFCRAHAPHFFVGRLDILV
jgi:hypothetical protein